jgi:hypothetical protein
VRKYTEKNRMYLKIDKYAAMADWITRHYGLECSANWTTPIVEFLPDTKPKNGPLHATNYYNEGGDNWPDRWLLYNEYYV